MKIKILSTILGISFLLNIAGLVFFIRLQQTQSKLNKVKRERNLIEQCLTTFRANNVVADTPDTHLVKRTFISHVDGTEDWYGILPPAVPGKLDNTLVVYLHGMGSNFLEPFIHPGALPITTAIVSKYPDVCLLSCNYRKEASWGSAAALSDITQNVRQVVNQYPFKKIVIMGTSMGGYTALNYAAVAPADIRDKICGVVSVEGAGDLAELYKSSNNPNVQAAIVAALGGTPEQAPAAYAEHSFFHNLGALPKSVRFCIVSAREDGVVPTKLQTDVVSALQNEHYPVKLVEIESSHAVLPASVYVDALEFVRETN